jgi:capsular exopolysaccharide synthesis family protein
MNTMDIIPKPERAAGPRPETDPEAVGFQEFATMLQRWRWIILASVLAGCACAAIAHMTLPVRFSAAATVVLVAPQEKITDQTASAPLGASEVQSEIAIINSTAVAEIMVASLGLADNPAWGGETGGQPNAAPASEALMRLRRETAIRRVNDATRVNRLDTSYAIEIRVTTAKAEDAAMLANARVSAYLEWHRLSSNDNTAEAAGWINERLEELRTEVENKEAALESYRASQGLLSAEGSTAAEQQLASARAEAAIAEREFNETSARMKQVTDLRIAGGSVDTSAAAMNSALIQSLRVQEADVQRRLATLKQMYFDSHPSVQQVEAEARDVREGIDRELDRILINLNNEVTVARNRLSVARTALDNAQRRLAVNNAGIVRLRELERDFSASRDSYEEYLSMRQDASAKVTLAPAVARELSPAVVPRAPDRPALALLLAFGGAVGLLGSLSAMFLSRLLDDRLYGASDVLRKIGRRALVSIPRVGGDKMQSLAKAERNPAGYVVSKPFSAFAETYRVLSKAIYPPGRGRRSAVIAITSAVPDEGKTTTSWSLARVAALSGQKVIIVDCDLRRRSLSGFIDVKSAVGLSAVVSEPARLAEAIVNDAASGASVIPALVDDFMVNDLVGSPEMRAFIETLRKNYDLVVLDCPPVLTVADAIAAVMLADCTVVVTRANRTRARVVRAAINQIEAAGGEVAGLALNCVEPRFVGRYSFDDSLYFEASKSKYYIN